MKLLTQKITLIIKFVHLINTINLMSHIKIILVLFLVSILSFSCKNKAEPEIKTIETVTTTEIATKTLDPNATYAKAEFSIEGMTCAIGCAKTIEKKLSNLDGMKSATVDFDKRLAMVEYDEAKVNASILVETVTKAGDMYTVTDIETVENFDTASTCKADCKMACCADKATTNSATKEACKADCEKACCKDKVEGADKTMACTSTGTKACCTATKA
ncbi:heavy metal-associated domain-containing protein [Formosa sp. PL04]|uniref:heavy-metal-associated domain-containing protein n=1 Tax=Formosa sp. PL04 TaxID=3081755 RepID=UPI002981D10B|nr:heavy metal-associated domain-containing protein [Formosa sp. PL04]MDW5287244.1 heavy metal-associated domain-containing protein [Formosa sp. PL04]